MIAETVPAATSLRRRLLRGAASSLAPRQLLVTRGPAKGRQVALTFDDGPDDLTPQYLDELDRLRVRATFFVLGKACAERRGHLLEIVRRGHEVAVHGYSHRAFPPMEGEELRDEIEATARLLPPSTGRPMIRPPGGATSLGSLVSCARAGYTTVLWSLDSDDCRTRDAAEVARKVDPSRVTPGEIVLLHEGQRWTLDALPTIVERLREAGLSPVTVGELLGGLPDSAAPGGEAPSFVPRRNGPVPLAACLLLSSREPCLGSCRRAWRKRYASRRPGALIPLLPRGIDALRADPSGGKAVAPASARLGRATAGALPRGSRARLSPVPAAKATMSTRPHRARDAAPAWELEEPGLAEAVRHLRRLRRRAWARWGWTAIATVLVVLVSVGYRSRQQRTYTAEVVFRVAEGDIEQRSSPQPSKQLKEYVLGVAFARPRLLEVIRRHGLYPSKMSKDPGLAVDEMRENIEVDVARNYFLAERGPDDPPRSATVSISFRGSDPEVALAVTHDLSALVTEEERGARTAMATIAADEADAAAAELRAQMAEAQARRAVVSRKVLTASRQELPELVVEAGALKRTIEVLELRLRDAETQKGALELRRSMEDDGIGMQFELVDTRPPKRPFLSRRKELALVGLFALLLGLPLAAMAAGAFDRRIRSLEDVKLLGMSPIGRLPLPARSAGRQGEAHRAT